MAFLSRSGGGKFKLAATIHSFCHVFVFASYKSSSKFTAAAKASEASSLAAKVYAVCKASVPEASTDFSSAAETDEWPVRIVVETPCSWSAHPVGG